MTADPPGGAFCKYVLAALRLARSYVRFRWACMRAGITPAEARRRYLPRGLTGGGPPPAP
jgi:hypothetical protein